MSGVLRLESLTKGNTLKQGDKTPLKYRLFDADGEKLNIAGKSVKVRLVYPDFLTIGYEKDGLTVAQDDTVTFTIDKVIPAKLYHVEIIVDDKFIFPSRADESKFTVDKSSLGSDVNIIEIVGKDVLIQEVKTQVDTELQPLVAYLEASEQAEAQRVLAENERSEKYGSYAQQFNDVITELSEEKDYHSLPEIAGARGGHETLGQRLDETTTQLTQTNQKVNDLGINLRDFGVKDGDDITDILISLLDNSYKIIIPEGTYYWSKPIETFRVVKIEGSGKDKTSLVYKPNLENDLNQVAFNIRVASDDLNNIAEIEELTFKDESVNSLSLMRVARIFPNGDDRWAARVYFHKTDFYGYKNTGLTVIAPYEAVFSHLKFNSAEPFTNGYHQTPVNVTTGLKLTGVGHKLSIMGNVILIKGCSFNRHKYGVDVINCRGVNFEDTVFEQNWISVYLHSKNEATWSTLNIQFDNCWFEDTGNAHPTYYVVDCFIDETTGEVDTTKERARNINVANTVFFSTLGKQAGFPANNIHLTAGNLYSSAEATKNHFIRQWDSTEELNDFPNNDGVITQIGGEHNYFRGKVTGANGFQKNLSSTGLHNPRTNYVYENLEHLSFSANSNKHVVLVDLREFNIPDMSRGNDLTTIFLNSQITLMIMSAEGIPIQVEMEYSGKPLWSNDSSRHHDFKTKYPNTTRFNLHRIDPENEDNDNNRGVRLSREGYNLKFEFDVNGLRGGRIFFENKYIVYEATTEFNN